MGVTAAQKVNARTDANFSITLAFQLCLEDNFRKM
jgi:hypothetical protein